MIMIMIMIIILIIMPLQLLYRVMLFLAFIDADTRGNEAYPFQDASKRQNRTRNILGNTHQYPTPLLAPALVPIR